MNTESAGLSAKLVTLDQVADAALPRPAQARYTAYRNALIADGQDDEQVVQTLWLFLWDLSEGRSVNGVH
ncbi:hypothetical protein GCM10011487_22510 [Steroidobacter agaridevorans]|uniref:Uncharacterized protein n=1 Tax=Steroidobacter agaridevorans TaxID=2695856 RepID=A0A829YBJ2_9GAMM|nr:hypothetical protein [Steroidobacter agaridevorans]GFE80251.1 hypothetical protein GCM10011487_22510 [Steroidobacter agaridevorans]GFE87238.1 hypothetical protein GCM10011488_21920 [Steroidobacter agaridevorans]